MQHDKKVSNGIIQFIILEKLGQAGIRSIEQHDILRRTLADYLP